MTYRALKYPHTYFNNDIQLGDLNVDGIVNVLDIVMMVNIILEGDE